jgi:hypothetical protein
MFKLLLEKKSLEITPATASSGFPGVHLRVSARLCYSSSAESPEADPFSAIVS